MGSVLFKCIQRGQRQFRQTRGIFLFLSGGQHFVIDRIQGSAFLVCHIDAVILFQSPGDQRQSDKQSFKKVKDAFLPLLRPDPGTVHLTAVIQGLAVFPGIQQIKIIHSVSPRPSSRNRSGTYHW